MQQILREVGDGIDMSFRERFLSFLINFASVFEPIAARFISYYVRRELKEWKEKGLILEYKTKTRRIGKFHYKTQIDVILSSEQAHFVLSDLLTRMYRILRR